MYSRAQLNKTARQLNSTATGDLEIRNPSRGFNACLRRPVELAAISGHPLYAAKRPRLPLRQPFVIPVVRNICPVGSWSTQPFHIRAQRGGREGLPAA